MKLLAIARKTLLEYWREPLLLGLLFAFPVMMVGLYYLAFGQTDQGLAHYLTLLVVNHDQGDQGRQLVESLRQARFDDQPVFTIIPCDTEKTAQISLRERKAAMLVVIPVDFSAALTAAGQTGQAGRAARTPVATIELVGETNGETFVFAQSLIEGVIRDFINRRIGWVETTTLDYEFLPGTGTMSDFDFGVAGTIVFGLMFVAVGTALTMVREQVNGTLRRLRLSAAGAFDLLGGVTLAQLALAVIVVPLTFGAAALMGFRGNGSLLLAMAVGLLFSLSAVGLGLLVACVTRTDSEAANLSASVGVVMVLLCGALYPMPVAPLATIGGRVIQVYDLLPPTHAAEAMRRVLIFGDGIAAIGYQLGAMAVLSLLFLGLGVMLYHRLRMRV
ncbi:MAG: ABC transporter permease [Chloroflexota bacterium]